MLHLENKALQQGCQAAVTRPERGSPKTKSDIAGVSLAKCLSCITVLRLGQKQMDPNSTAAPFIGSHTTASMNTTRAKKGKSGG